MFMAMDSSGRALMSGDAIDPGAHYVLIMSIKDNGSFDLDPAAGAILDPGMMAQTVTHGDSPPPKSTGGGMGGGCSLGLGSMALLILLPIFRKRF